MNNQPHHLAQDHNDVRNKIDHNLFKIFVSLMLLAIGWYAHELVCHVCAVHEGSANE